MHFEEILNTSRWSILESVAHGERGAAEIASSAKTSLPNVSQQMRLLEAYGLVTQRKEENDGRKPVNVYALAKEIGHVALVRKGFAGKKTLTMDKYHEAIMNIWFLNRNEDHYFLAKFFWQQEEFINACTAVAVVESKGDEIHLLVLAAPDKVADIRKRFSKILLTGPDGGKKRNIISWTHSISELEDGIARQDSYFKNLLKSPHIIIDKEGALQAFMK